MSEENIEELEKQLAVIEKRREGMAQERYGAYLAQHVKDKAAVADLEAEHGVNRIWTVEFQGWEPDRGAATLIAVLLPERKTSKWQRFQKLVLDSDKKSQKTIAAIEQLARTCVVYPHRDNDKETYEATVELAAGCLNAAASMIADKLSGVAKEDEKK